MRLLLVLETNPQEPITKLVIIRIIILQEMMHIATLSHQKLKILCEYLGQQPTLQMQAC